MNTTTEASTSAHVIPPEAPQSLASRLVEHARRAKGVIIAVAGVGAVLSGLVGYYTTYKTVTGAATTAAAHPASPNSVNPLSIVALPFANLTGDPTQDYVAAGLTANVTSDLSRIRDAFIVSAATAAAFKDKAADVQQVGKALGVRYVLQGSVQRNGNKIRINAQLADTSTAAQLWTESFEADQGDLFALQDRVTTRIGNSIGREMVVNAARESEKRKSSPKVADLILRARALNLVPRNVAFFDQIEALYREVLAMEPNNVNALVGLANNMALRAGYFSHTLPDAQAKEKYYVDAKNLALKAKQLDPDYGPVYLALMLYAEGHDDYPGQLRAAQKGHELAPRDPRLTQALAHTLLMGGDPNGAIQLLEEAMSQDPKRPVDQILFNLGWANFMRGDYDVSIDWYQKTIEANTTYIDAYGWIAMSYAIKGDMEKSQAFLAKLKNADPKGSFVTRRKPMSSSPDAYKTFYNEKYLPAARKAGIMS